MRRCSSPHRAAAAVAVAVLCGTGAAAGAADPGAAESPVAESPAAEWPAAESPVTAANAAPEEGAWVLRQVNFNYMGFTSFYSCDSLASRLRTLLVLSGAREDLKVRPRGCAEGSNQVTRMPGARLEFRTFVPAAKLPPPPPPAPKTEAPARQLGRDAPKLKRVEGAANEPGVGAWRTVALDGRGLRDAVEAGDCELVEQFVREVLPLFTTRNVEDRTRCAPGHRSSFDVNLRFEALGPVPTADAPRR
jgi:hypothetical protein